MLLKIALIVGVEVHVNVEFVKLLEPPEDQGPDGNQSSCHLSANHLALRTTLALRSPWCYLGSHLLSMMQPVRPETCGTPRHHNIIPHSHKNNYKYIQESHHLFSLHLLWCGKGWVIITFRLMSFFGGFTHPFASGPKSTTTCTPRQVCLRMRSAVNRFSNLFTLFTLWAVFLAACLTLLVKSYFLKVSYVILTCLMVKLPRDCCIFLLQDPKGFTEAKAGLNQIMKIDTFPTMYP